MPAHVRNRIADALGSGAGIGHAPHRVIAAVNHAFVSALSIGLTVTGSIAVVGALVAFSLVRRTVPRPGQPRPRGLGRSRPRPRPSRSPHSAS